MIHFPEHINVDKFLPSLIEQQSLISSLHEYTWVNKTARYGDEHELPQK